MTDVNSRIKIVVRVRPLSERELQKRHRSVLQANGPQMLSVSDPCIFEQKGPLHPELLAGWSRDFCFDRCLWSDDTSRLDYADQGDLFKEVGEPVLDWILNGYNCCVLAFGQTGSGKTYSMMGKTRGSPEHYGLVPRICYRLFESLEELGEGHETTVTLSHLEIYNELVKDLLAPAGSASLRVREHPQRGVFVLNLTQVRVASFEHVLSLMTAGDKNRTVAATDANAHSSRSHAVVTLTVVQRTREAPVLGLPTSALRKREGRVHLVDLAGSERVSNTGAKGVRLKEASSINRSLSVLGDVILSLASGKRGHIPYRNSTLTMVLKDSLGGNAHAIMLTTVSPSSFDYDETLSTLKYADRAKKVRMRVDPNVTSGLLATDASAMTLVPLLQAEISKLREMLKAQQEQQQQQQMEQMEQSFKQEAQGREDQRSQLAVATTSSSTSPASPHHAAPSASSPLLPVPSLPSLPPPTALPTSPPPPPEEAVVPFMWERLRELERQLADRERLIESLEGMREQRQAFTPHPHQPQPQHSQHSHQHPNQHPSQHPHFAAPFQPPYPFYHSEDYSFQEPYLDEAEVYGTSTFLPLTGGTPPESGRGGGAKGSEARARGSIVSAAKLKSRGGGAGEGAQAPAPQTSDGLAARTRPLVVLADDAQDTSLPRVINLNQDPLFSECLVYYLPAGEVLAGSRESDADILLSGPDIQARHCVLAAQAGRVVLRACEGALVFVNGCPVEDGRGVALRHFDRIAMGRFHLFRFEHEEELSAGSGEGDGAGAAGVSGAEAVAATPPGWEFAQQELMSASSQRRAQIHSRAIMQARSLHSSPARQPFSPPYPSSPYREGAGGYEYTDPPPQPGAQPWPQASFYYSQTPQPSGASTPHSSPTKSSHSNGPSAHHTASAASAASDDAWWARVNEVAEGAAAGSAEELREMLRSLVEKAEGRRGAREGGAAAAAGAMWAGGLGPLEREGGAGAEKDNLPLKIHIPPSVAAAQAQGLSPLPSPSSSSSSPYTPYSPYSPPPPPPISSSPPTPTAPAHTIPITTTIPNTTNTIPTNTNTNTIPTNTNVPASTTAGPGGPSSFEREAQLLSQELAGMQKSLRERMARYSGLGAEYTLPHG